MDYKGVLFLTTLLFFAFRAFELLTWIFARRPVGTVSFGVPALVCGLPSLPPDVFLVQIGWRIEVLSADDKELSCPFTFRRARLGVHLVSFICLCGLCLWLSDFVMFLPIARNRPMIVRLSLLWRSSLHWRVATASSMYVTQLSIDDCCICWRMSNGLSNRYALVYCIICCSGIIVFVP